MKTNPQPAHTTIGAFEAKTHLSDILRRVGQGERFTITVRGRAVAEVIPTDDLQSRRVSMAVEALMNFPRVQGVDGETVQEWIREGRR